MNPDDEFLASAYLDGELTADEQRLAEADPTVMAEVAELRALRTQLADVGPPSADARESAIATAMGEFALRYGSSEDAPAQVAATQARVVPLTRRPRYATWLTAAAALVAVGVLGVVVVNSRGGDDQMTSSDAGEDATEQLSDSRLTESAPETLAASDAADTDAAAAATIAADDAMAASEAAEATLDMAADDGSTGGAAGDAADSAPMSEMAIDPSLFFDLPGQLEANTSPRPITSIDELTSAIGYLLDLAERGELGPTPETRCPYPVLAEGVVLIGTTPDDVFVAALVDDDLAIALDRDSCDIVLEAPIGRR